MTELSIEDVIAKAKPRETVVRLCMAGDLVAEHEHLEAELETLSRGKFIASSLADVDPARAIADRVIELEKEMIDATVEIRLRALTGGALDRLIEAHPPKPGREAEDRYDIETFSPALLGATAVAPTMTAKQARDLLDALSAGQQNMLLNAAWSVCQEATSVPFSHAASVTIGMRD